MPLKEYEALLQISYFVDSAMELDDILEKIVAITARTMKADICSIYLRDVQNEHLELRAAQGLSDELKSLARYRLGEGIPGYALQHGQTVAISDAPSDPRYKLPEGMDSSQDHWRAWICAPLVNREERIGVMSLRFKDKPDFDATDRVLFETICKQIAIVVEKSRLYFDKIEAERMAAIGLSLSEISHSIKNILSNMQGGLYIVDSSMRSGNMDRANQAWELLKRNNRKIADLVQNMLAFSRNTEMNLQLDNFNALINDVLETVDKSARSRKVFMDLQLEADLQQVYFDYDNLYDAVLNLVNNAIQSVEKNREDGRVTISTKLDRDNNQVELCVADNGCGISEEDKKNIFKLFFSTKGVQGTGIGLAVTQKIVKQHEGHIWFESHENESTKFFLRIPSGNPQ